MFSSSLKFWESTNLHIDLEAIDDQLNFICQIHVIYVCTFMAKLNKVELK